MYKTPQETKAFFETFLSLRKTTHDVLFAVPYIDLIPALIETAKSPYRIGVQNIHEEKEGAYTGEISAHMVKATGGHFSLVGHSERRKYFLETDELIHKKLKSALSVQLEVILCIGETLEQRESGQMASVLKKQIETALQGIQDFNLLSIAYEPVWAIGTGKAATPKEAGEAHALLREYLAPFTDQRIPLLYGGSVKPDNVKAIVSQKEVDGVLVGGASLTPHDFSQLVHNC